MMDAGRWDVVKRLFEAALGQPAAEQAAFVQTACGADVELRREVESLLAAHAEAGSFAEHPPVPAASVSAALDAAGGDRARLQPGARVGSYEIRGFLAAGAMGDVYRAHDLQLRRDVALKLLPVSLTADPDRVARFEREARVLAALNHPHIAAIYGFEQQTDVASGVSRTTQALVLELVEGPTLAERVAKDALPIKEALEIARQIAEALEAAHEKGIVHRDLKPANIKVTADGTVKVLDFGLAKALAADGSGAGAWQSPAVTVEGTRDGVIVGTPAYMSPEQARGQAIDKRTDIWAFGCVLYEMLTGKAAFHGQTVSETLAEVMKSEPLWTALPPDTPATLRNVVRRCLEKDPRQRVRDIGDVRLALEGAFEPAAAETSALASGVPAYWRRPWILGLGMLLVGAAITGVGIWFVRPASSTDPEPVSRFTITLPADQPFTAAGRHLVALSPQGTHLVYQANDRLYLRAIDQLSATPIQGTETGTAFGRSPFFSPDGQWIAFWQGGELRKIALTGGVPVKLCEAQNPWGASWGPDDTVLYGQGPAGIWRVSGQGGTPQRVVSVDERKGESAHGPQLLPGGRAVLFTLAAGDGWDEAQIVVQVLDSSERKVVLSGGRDARYVETGHLVYARRGTLLAVPFDLDDLAVTGGPVSLVEGVRYAGTTGATHFSLSRDGTLIYVVQDSGQAPQSRLVWVDRSGAEQPLAAPARLYENPRLSPDGRRAVVEVAALSAAPDPGGGPEGGEDQLWVYDLARDTLTRLTFEGSNNEHPVWTPDGKRIAFESNKDGVPDKIFWQLADSSGGSERLTTDGEGHHAPRSWSADGQLLAFDEWNPHTQHDIWVLRLSDRKAEPFLRTPFEEGAARFSPDGRWLAYVSNESSRPEVYVQPYPGPGGKSQVSIDGGTEPVWSRNGRELFYRSGNRMMVVETRTQPTFSAGKPRMLFEGPADTRVPAMSVSYDLSADGQRFLIVRQTEAASRSAGQINVVLNWFNELKRRVPR